MHETKTNELREIAALIEARREALGLSKNALCKKFGQLGSTKTYGRILDHKDDLAGLTVVTQLENYKAALELLEGFTEDPELSKVYGDFDFMEDALQTVREAMDEPGICRLVLITGRMGAGKSAFIEHLQEHRSMRNITYAIEATEAWRESTNELLGAALREIGVFDRSPRDEEGKEKGGDTADAVSKLIGPGARLRKLVERADGRKLVLAIDEAHHIGPAGYNIVKTLINQTRLTVVMTAIPDLITRINRNSHVEAAQLFVNRLYCHIRFGPPEAGEVLEFFKRRGLKFAGNKEANEIANKVANDAVTFGLRRYVERCSREARKLGDKALTIEDFAKVIVRVKTKISLG